MQQTTDTATSEPAPAPDGAIIAGSDAELSQERLKAAQAARFREIGMLTRSLIEAEEALIRERAAHEATREALEQAQYASQSYQEVISSTSWRVTAPLRWMTTKLRP